jgi:phosphatidylinositol kinase/protein kinase (PI-3  family)
MRALFICDTGVFRVACELTMRLLRENKDTLMSILDAFIHDPLVEWRDEKRKQVCNIASVHPPSLR